MIYFVVDEYDHTKDESDNHEDLNMNTEKDQNNVNEAAENNARLSKYRKHKNSMEMSELHEEKKEEQEVPQVTQSRHNLLSEGIVLLVQLN